MVYTLYVFLLGGLLFIVGCQRNTDELPTTDIFFTKTCYSATNVPQLVAYFDEHIGQQPYYLSAHFVAEPQQSYYGARITAETYTGAANFNSVQFSAPIVQDTIRLIVRRYDSGGATPEEHPIKDLLVTLNNHFPGDVGILCIFLLNIVSLEPGQAIFLQANEPHAYLCGGMWFHLTIPSCRN